MNFTLHQLRIFQKVTEKQSITKASEELHLTQPAISIQLKNLQDQFEIPLVEIVGRKLHVTDFGRELADRAALILSEVDELEASKMAHLGYVSGKLTISTVSTAKYVMPYFLDEFLKQYPGIELHMDVTNKGRVIEDLDSNRVDFSMVSVLPPRIKLESLGLMENKLFLVGSPGYLSSSAPKELKENHGISWIFRENGSATRQAMEAFLNKKGIEPKKSLILTSNEAVKQALIAGLGISIMPLIGIRNEIQNGELQIFPVKGLPIKTEWNIVWLKDKHLSPASTAYLEFLSKEREGIIEKHFAWSREYR